MRAPSFASVLRRVTTDENLDVYSLCAAAAVFTVLGVAGVADVRLLSSVILAFLAVMAWSQVRTRQQLERAATSSDTMELLYEFPQELAVRRKEADDLYYVGVSMSRTLYTSRDEFRQLLVRGGRLRVLLVDPTIDAVMRDAALRYAGQENPNQVRSRVENSLKELEYLRSATGGNLEIRVSANMHHVGINAVDPETPKGMVVVQHYEHRPAGEPGPIFALKARQGFWFRYFIAEAERLWDDGAPWPPRATPARLAGLRSSSFVPDFDARLIASILATDHLFVTGIARNALLTNHFGAFEELLRRGGQLRILLLDPSAAQAVETAADRYYAQRSPAILRERILQSLGFLSELRDLTKGDLEVRLTAHPLAMGMLGLACTPDAPSREDTALFMEYYTFQAPGEPKFFVDATDSRWREQFLGEARALWNGAKPCDLKMFHRR